MATNKFNIVLAAKFDKTQIQNTLDKMKNVKLLVAVKFDKTQIQTALNEAMGKVGTAKSGTTTGGKTTSGVSAASTKASQSKVASGLTGEVLATEIEQDRVEKITKLYDEQNNLIKTRTEGYDKIGQKVKEIADSEGNIKRTTVETGALATKNLQTFERLSAKLEDLKSRKLISNQDYEKLKQSLNGINKETDEFAKNKAFDKVNMQIKNATKGSSTFSSQIFKMVGNVSKLAIAWGIVDTAIQLVKKGIEQTIENIKNLDEGMTKIQMVTGGTAAETAELRNQYIALAKEMGVTTQDVMDGANDLLRAGMTAEETTAALRASLTLSTISGMSSADATQTLIATMRAYNIEAKDTMSIVDKISRVDAAAATSAEDLGAAISRGAASAKLAGLDLDEYLGMAAAISDQLQISGEEAGRGLRTIFARAQRVKLGYTETEEGDDLSSYLSDVDRATSAIGLDWKEATNNLSDMGAGLELLAQRWGELNTQQQAQLAEAFAGKHRREIFLSMMESYDKINALTKESEESVGSAEEKYAIYGDSIKATLNGAKAGWEELASTLMESGIVDSIVQFIRELSDVLATIFKYITLIHSSNLFGLSVLLDTISFALDLIEKTIDLINVGIEKFLSLFSPLKEKLKEARDIFVGWLKMDVSDEINKTGETTTEYDDKVGKLEKTVASATETENEYTKAIKEQKGVMSSLAEELENRLNALDREKKRLDNEKKIQEKLLNIEKARAKLAKAREKRVLAFRAGKGFVELEDFDELQQAQEDLNSAVEDYNATVEDLKTGALNEMLELLKAPDSYLDTWEEYFNDWKILQGTEFDELYKQAKDFMEKYTKLTASGGSSAGTGTGSTPGAGANASTAEKIANGGFFFDDTKKTEHAGSHGGGYGSSSNGSTSGGSTASSTTSQYTAEEIKEAYDKVNAFIDDSTEQYDSYIAFLAHMLVSGVVAYFGKLSSSQQAELMKKAESKSKIKNWQDIPSHATGTTSAQGGLSLVGEQGAELRVLNRGDGIIPAGITKNLWELGKNPSKAGNTTISINNLNLPNVQDVDNFLNEIQKIAATPRRR